LLSWENEVLQKKRNTQLDATIFSGNPTPPIRHPSFRWDDEHLAIPATRAETFSGQQWAFAGKTILSFLQYPNKWRLS
jgi:hypothetical protein